MQTVLQPSASIPEGTPTIRGWDFNDGVSLNGIMDSMLRTGCQASALGQACNEVNRMVSWSLSLLQGHIVSVCYATVCLGVRDVSRLQAFSQAVCNMLCEARFCLIWSLRMHFCV